MSYVDHHPGYRLSTEMEAVNWIEELVLGAEQARVACDVAADPEKAVRAYQTFLVKHGSALGSLMALHRAGLLSDVGYNELRARAMRALTPTMVARTTT